MVIDEAADSVFQLACAAVDAAPDLFFGQLSKPALDQIEPGSRGGSEVQVEARTFGKPAADPLGFMPTVVVQDEVHLEFCGHVAFDDIEKSAELTGTMTMMKLAQHVTAGDVESGEQAGGSVPFVVMATALDLSGAHGQKRRSAIQRLNLALLVHAQNQRSVGRVQIEADDVADLVDKQRITAQLKGLAAMRLQGKSAPDATDAALANPVAWASERVDQWVAA